MGTERTVEINFDHYDDLVEHFHCSSCNEWWIIDKPPKREYWWCPWCGVKLASKFEDDYEETLDMLNRSGHEIEAAKKSEV